MRQEHSFRRKFACIILEVNCVLIDTSDFRNGLSIIQDNDIYTIVEFQHVKPGKGGAFVRTKLKNVKSGAVIDKTFRAGEKMEQARLERRVMQYLYQLEGEYYLMDKDTFEQISVKKELIGDPVKYLKDGMEVTVMDHNGDIIGVEVPFFVELEVTSTDPGVRGDTASGGSKPAELETGAVIQVPFFVNVGDKVKVDTRSDTYLERVK
jgi:elongation factor P